jgi:diadenylate cyclase
MTLYLNVLSFIQFKITDLIDILLVAFILFQFYKWLKGTAAVRIFIGLMILFVIWKAVSLFQLNMLNVILEQFLSVGVILLIVVFQPELRKFLLYLGNTEVLKWARFYIKGKNIPADYAEDVEAITRACERMSASRTGALMVFARKNPLDEFLATGQEIDAVVSQNC